MRIPGILGVLMVVVAAACGGGGAETPAEVVKAYHKAVAADDYQKAEQYLTESIKQQMISNVGSVEAGIREQAERGKVQRVEILLKQTLGSGLTTLDMVYHYEGGNSATSTASLLREGGKYKLLETSP